MRHTYTLTCLSEAMSPLTHMQRTDGNEALVAREPLMTPEGVRQVPYLSGNAIRHRLVRAPLARHLISMLGLEGKLSLPQLNFLFHGGNLTEGGGREDTGQIADGQRLFPMLRLLGGSLPSQILAGALQVWRGTLVCRENEPALRAVLPPGYEVPGALRPAEWFVESYQYTRGDSRKGERDLVAEGEPAGADSNLMIFSGQQVVRHACFVHGFAMPDVSPLELGALALALRRWSSADATVGGQSARGHGRLRLAVLGTEGLPDLAAAERDYVSHVEGHAKECADWLHAAFRRREDKPARKGKAKPADTPIEVPADE